MSEEEIPSYARMLQSPEIVGSSAPHFHRDNSEEHQYIIEVSHDLPAIRLRVFLFPNGDAMTEAEFVQ